MDQEWKFSPNRYGPFGWCESLIKAIAAGVGVGSVAIYSAAVCGLLSPGVVCVTVRRRVVALPTGRTCVFVSCSSRFAMRHPPLVLNVAERNTMRVVKHLHCCIAFCAEGLDN